MSITMEAGRIDRERRTKENKENIKRKTLGAGKTIWSVFVGENVAGRRPATFSQKHGLCPFRCSGVLVFRAYGLGVQVFRCSGV